MNEISDPRKPEFIVSLLKRAWNTITWNRIMSFSSVADNSKCETHNSELFTGKNTTNQW